MADPSRKSRSRQTALMRVARRDIPEHTVVDDLVTLLEQLHTGEDARDRDAVAAIAERYGFEPERAAHG